MDVVSIGILLVPLTYWVAWIIGMTAVYRWIGNKVRVAMRGNSHRPFLDVTIGVLTITVFSLVVTCIPVLGWGVRFLLGMAALGALVLTRFGTQEGIEPTVRSTALPPASAD